MFKIVGEIGEMQLSLAFPYTFSLKSPLPASTAHTSSLLIKAPSIKQGEVLLLAGGMGNGTFFFCATSKADMHISRWHLHTEPVSPCTYKTRRKQHFLQV